MRHVPRSLVAFSLPMAVAACVIVPLPGPGQTVTTPLIRSDDQQIGTVRMTAAPAGVTMRIEAAGLPPGIHGVHVHAVGRCDRHDFSTAGPHWNPAGRQHGHANPAGFHAGDLGNLEVGADGRLTADLLIPGARLPVATAKGPGEVLADADGAALVLHAAPDDERTDPSGNSGDRIACAVLASPIAS